MNPTWFRAWFRGRDEPERRDKLWSKKFQGENF
jgi:hypothetical protein